MSSNFITNSGADNLDERIRTIIAESAELKFLVGFFYFSGIDALYESLRDNKDATLKILVGLHVDKTVRGLYEYSEEGSSSDDQIEVFFESMRRSLNSSEFDTKRFYEQITYYVDLLKNNKLVIRKTHDPNHAKLYIFSLNQNQVGRPMFITGSSNLTGAGFSRQQEFNVEISDYGYDDANLYFDELWEHAINITETPDLKSRLISTLQEETHIKKITPFEAYAFVLKSYLDIFQRQELSDNLSKIMKERGYVPYKYQMDAARQALSIINDYGGVVIADVVGLGKSVIASIVAKEIGKRGIIICPPGLIGERHPKSGWHQYAEDFGLNDLGWDIYSAGSLDDVHNIVKDRESIETVIIDEAHRFRNQDTQAYEVLSSICRGKKVMLLTATPFNNEPNDLLSLVQLFIAPKKSPITLDDNLKNKFRQYNSQFKRIADIKKLYRSQDGDKQEAATKLYKKLFGDNEIDTQKIQQRVTALSKDIRSVIEPITVRRNRIDLLENPAYSAEVKELSTVEPPQEWLYGLTPEQSKFYDQILKEYFADPGDNGRFKGAIYQPFEYEHEETSAVTQEDDEESSFERTRQRNLYDFMRRLMVKRFESSFGAFDATLERFIGINQKVQKFIESSGGKFILHRKLIEKMYDDDPDEIDAALEEYEQELNSTSHSKNHKIYDVNSFVKKSDFLDDIASDIQLFEEVRLKLGELDFTTYDPKMIGLIKKLKDSLSNEPSRKIIIFTEYADTVSHLAKKLDTAFNHRVLAITGKLSSSILKEINENFDASSVNKLDKYDILLTTDRLAEGFNLNRAGLVVNYDIPWNPVRVIQRVGRINRMSKKVFESLQISNFFPTEKGANYVKSREIAQHKMFMIHNTLGEDAQIFDTDEEPSASALYQRINSNPEESEVESFYTKAVKDFQQIIIDNPDMAESLAKMPRRVKAAKKYEPGSLLVFIKKGNLYVRTNNGKMADSSLENVYDQIKCDPSEKGLALSGQFWERYEAIKEWKAPTISLSENSLEKKALRNLALLRNRADLSAWYQFLDSLNEDIEEYGSIPAVTLRKIANLEIDDSPLQLSQKLEKLAGSLGGEHYLETIKMSIASTRKEIIIAVENQPLSEKPH